MIEQGSLIPYRSRNMDDIRRVVIDNKMTADIREQLDKQLEEWEQQISKKQSGCMSKEHKIFDNKQNQQDKEDGIDAEEYFDNEK